jgi:hypothetical protein
LLCSRCPPASGTPLATSSRTHQGSRSYSEESLCIYLLSTRWTELVTLVCFQAAAGCARQRRHLFDGMAQGSNAAKRRRTTSGDGKDRLSALPEEVLLYILSLLPSCDLVQQTCRLASRGWRNLWKSVPALRISGEDDLTTVDEMTKFMNYLVALRCHNPLIECNIKFWHVRRRSPTSTFGTDMPWHAKCGF